MRVIAIAFLSGLMFGAGLMVSGMSDPAKVLGFLDLAGRWDPSLAFVMAGAIAIAGVCFAVARRRARSWLGEAMQIPGKAPVTMRLVVGSAMFGIGWAMAGFCPGPALVAVAAGVPKAWGFLAAMLAGMRVFDARADRTAAMPAPPAAKSD